MWFKRESASVKRQIERAARRFIGRRSITIVIGLLIVGTAAIPAIRGTKQALPWVLDLWNYKEHRAGAYIEELATGQFFSHRVQTYTASILAGKPLHNIVTVDQTATVTACTLKITMKRQARLQWNDDAPTIAQDYTTVMTIRLGSIRTLELTPKVKTYENENAQHFQATPDAYHVYVANTDESSVRETQIAGKKNDFPMDIVGWIGEFHVRSPQPISQFVDSLLYLDQQCGNSTRIEPVFLPNNEY